MMYGQRMLVQSKDIFGFGFRVLYPSNKGGAGWTGGTQWDIRKPSCRQWGMGARYYAKSVRIVKGE